MSHFTFEVPKGFPSLNKFYSSPHWTYRSKMKNTYVKTFSYMILEAKVPKMQTYALDIQSNLRMDLDNCIMVIKFFNDALKALELIEDDTPDIFRWFTIAASSDVKRSTAVLSLYFTKAKA